MKTVIRSIALAAFVFCFALAVFSQDRGRPSGGSSSPAPSSGSVSSGSSDSSRGIAGSVVSSGSAGGTYYSPSRSVGISGGSGGGTAIFAPRYPIGSSFNPYNYERSMYFFGWLQSNYWCELARLGLWDMGRFYRNREPLMTPNLVHLTFREPLAASQKLLDDVEALQGLVEAMQAGQKVDKDEIEAKTQEIRSLAKKIRQYQPIAYFDLRKSRDLTKGMDNSMGLGAIKQLREMAEQLHSQLQSTYNQKVTSTVSVNSLNEASFESLSKGIEKLAKVIENSKPRS